MKLNKIGATLLLLFALPLFLAFQSCSSDEDSYIVDLPDALTINYGEKVKLVDDIDDGVLVVPASYMKMEAESDDNNVIATNGLALEGVGVGKTNVSIYDGKGDSRKLIKTLNVTVEPNFTISMKCGGYNTLESLISDSEDYSFYSDNDEIAEWLAQNSHNSSKWGVHAKYPGTAYLYSSKYSSKNKYAIKVEVTPVTTENPFTLPYSDFGVSVTEAKEALADYNCTLANSVRLKYEPFGKYSEGTLDFYRDLMVDLVYRLNEITVKVDMSYDEAMSNLYSLFIKDQAKKTDFYDPETGFAYSATESKGNCLITVTKPK